MSTATTRLRRAGAGGLAAAVIAGTLIAGAGAAQAATTFAVANVGTAPTIYVGSNGQSGADVKITLGTAWAIGDAVTLSIPNTAPNDCTIAGNTIGLSGTPSGTAAKATTATASTDILPTFTVAVSAPAGACTTAGVNKIITLTLTNNTTATQTASPTITLTGIKYNVGSTATPGNLTLNLGGATTTTLTNAVVANTKFSAASVVPVTTSTAAVNGIALSNMTAADVASAHIASPIKFTLSAGVWTTGSTPTLTGAGTWTLQAPAAGPPATGLGTDTIVFTSSSTLPTTANTYVLSGAKMDLPASTPGAVTVTASYGTAPVVAIGAPATVVSAVYQTRIGGTDRYATAAALFNAKFGSGWAASVALPTKPTSVVLASGALFPDALSGNFLASQNKTGILLTQPTVLPSVTFNAIATNSISTVYIVGGTGAVSAAVENQIASTHVGNNAANPFINVVRIGGSDRYATNLAVNEYQFATHTTAVIATGSVFADALSVGPAVYSQKYPLILTTPTALSAAAKQQLVDMGVTNVVIVGGTGAVSSAVETAIKGMGITITARLAGTDRTQTAAAIATWETNTVANGGLAFTGVDTVHFANGADFPDALAAGPVAGLVQNVILLAQSPTVLGPGAPSYLSGMAGTVDTLNALGLTGAVSPAVMSAAAVALAS